MLKLNEMTAYNDYWSNKAANVQRMMLQLKPSTKHGCCFRYKFAKVKRLKRCNGRLSNNQEQVVALQSEQQG